MSRRVDHWLLAGYAGVAGFLLLEATVRSPEGAELTSTEEDQGTTRALIAGYIAAGVATPALRRLPLRPLPPVTRPIGMALQAVGLALRAWSMTSLRNSYSRTLRVTNAQVIVESGPYRRVRHPGYLGSLLIWLGFALTSGSAAAVAAVTGLLAPTYRRRMEIEEQLLAKELDGYEDYCSRTYRLIPRVW